MSGPTNGTQLVATPDGRDLEVLTVGDPDGLAWVFHGGSPSAVAAYDPFAQAAWGAGLQMIAYSRPGYGGSTPRVRPTPPGPRMVDDLDDTVAVLDALEVQEFVTLGWSGGGPRALACACLLPDRCLAAATLAGVGPHDGEGLDWLAGMAADNVAEYAAAERGAVDYEAFLTEHFLPMAQVTGAQVAESLGGLLTVVDRAFATAGFADWLAHTFRRALAQGVVGTRDDGLAAVAPWGFDPAEISVPVSVWQGRADAMVPFAHGRWLAERIPGAHAHLFDDQGHLSLVARLPEILTDLRVLAGLSPRVR